MDRLHNDVRIATVGNSDSGKSTIIGVLTKGLMDNGDGSARHSIFNTPQEAKTGKTTTIAQEIMGFDEQNRQVAYDNTVIKKKRD